MAAAVIAVARDGTHRFSKQPAPAITLLAGLGVEGDAHAGVTVKHRSRVAKDPTVPNLRQLHLIQAELFDELAEAGFRVASAELGENVTTRGIDLLALPTGARLRLGATALVEVTGLRNPCHQIDAFQPGLMKAVLGRAADGSLIRKSGVMAVVLEGGIVAPGDAVLVEWQPAQFHPLAPV